MVALEAGTGQKGLDAAGLPAVALRRGGALLVGDPGQGVVAPLAGDLVRSIVNPPADRDAAANAGAEDHAEHRVVPATGAVARFREGETVRVVGNAHGPAEPGLQVGLQGPAVEPGGVRVLDQAGSAGDDAGDADADGAAAPGLRLQLGDEPDDGVQSAFVLPWGRHAPSGGDDAVGRERDGFRLGAPQVDADLHQVDVRSTASRRCSKTWLIASTPSFNSTITPANAA